VRSGDHGRRSDGARAHLGQALLEDDAARADRLCGACARGDRLALWDIKGKALGQPVWRLLGGARDRVPVYATFGFGFFDREQLAAAAKLWVAQGFSG
jgi:L-alanine-DL-glutamate epimerase-like enolase superfamily enzyme